MNKTLNALICRHARNLLLAQGWPEETDKDVAAGSALPGHAGHGLVGFQLCSLSVVCGLCRASIVAGLLRAGCKVR
ncbi:TPA: hypothetical protein L7312_003780 [Escherichia coli]|nr:hypothetical protein [Escherichia coli]HBQ4751624.1 hypothetical protein [Escherichia coli]